MILIRYAFKYIINFKLLKQYHTIKKDSLNLHLCYKKFWHIPKIMA
jgi:hypothetical protein